MTDEAREAMHRAVDRVSEERRLRTRGQAQTSFADELIDALGREGFHVTPYEPTRTPEARYVVWLDSTGTDGWAERGEVSEHEPALIESIGFVVVDTDTHLTLTLALTDDGHTCGAFMVIPKGAIRHSHVLEGAP